MIGTPALRAYCIPFIVFMLFLALADWVQGMKLAPFLLANPRYLLYPTQTVLCGVFLLHYWRRYPFQWPTRGIDWALTVGIAVLVLGIWISPQEVLGLAPRYNGFDPSLLKENPAAYWSTLGFRFLRLVVVVPLVEEIFWRGFLMRYLIKEDFESVRLGAFTRFSFIAVAVAFALAHWGSGWLPGPDFWPALATGLLYNALMVRTRSIGACVIAHAITNLLLGLYIMKTGQWGFW